MKCEKCNNREATFFYSSNINGEKNERHLCSECARQEGFGGALDYSTAPVGLFGDIFDNMFADFFSPGRSLMSSFGSFGMPLRSIMAPSMAMPRVDIVIGDPSSCHTAEESEGRIPDDAGDDVKKRRELEALKNALEEAVKAEDFEKAIELRDRIRSIEQSR